MQTATVKIFNGAEWQNVTGKVVNRPATGVTVEDARGVRWFAFNDRATFHTGADAGSAQLW